MTWSWDKPDDYSLEIGDGPGVKVDLWFNQSSQDDHRKRIPVFNILYSEQGKGEVVSASLWLCPRLPKVSPRLRPIKMTKRSCLYFYPPTILPPIDAHYQLIYVTPPPPPPRFLCDQKVAKSDWKLNLNLSERVTLRRVGRNRGARVHFWRQSSQREVGELCC